MASSENQGLQIALIILFILLIMLSLSTFMFFNQYNDADNRALTYSQKADEKERSATLAASEIIKLKEMIGLNASEDDPDLVKATETFTADKAKYLATIPADKQFYRQGLEELANTNKAIGEQLTVAKDEMTKLGTVNATYQKTADAQVKAFEDEKNKFSADLEAQRLAFKDAQTKAEEEKKALLTQFEEAQKKLNDEGDAIKKTVEQLTKDLTVCKKRNEELLITLARLRGETYSVDDGEIRSVNQRGKTVWINLGRVDALRPQVTFTVHSADSRAGASEGVKGRIEVTQILGDHLAEARIIEDYLTDPLLPGDKIYTPLWDPGRPERFAIAGKIDIDRDGRDDRDQLKAMIAMSGGIVDAELDAEGKLAGAISADTRYLIVGPAQDKARSSYDKLIQDGKLLGVEQIGIDKFVDHIGWRGPSQLVRFGDNSNAGEFSGDLPDGGIPRSPGKPSALFDQFKQRRPPGSAPAGAPKAPTGSTPGASAYYRF